MLFGHFTLAWTKIKADSCPVPLTPLHKTCQGANKFLWVAAELVKNDGQPNRETKGHAEAVNMQHHLQGFPPEWVELGQAHPAAVGLL